MALDEDKARYERARRKRILLYGSSGLSSDPTGTIRRAQALMLRGWFAREIAAEMGWTDHNHVLELQGRTWVRPETAERMRLVFRRLYFRTPPPHPLRDRTRAAARRKGYQSALSFDDIDDPNELPQGTLDVG